MKQGKSFLKYKTHFDKVHPCPEDFLKLLGVLNQVFQGVPDKGGDLLEILRILGGKFNETKLTPVELF